MGTIWLVVFFSLFAWLVGLTLFLAKTHRRLTRLLDKLLHAQSVDVPDLKNFFRHYQLVKYNPFPDTGGEQSFVFTLLNGKKDGIMLTSLHGRGVTRFYAKKITAGHSQQELSNEERSAIAQALTDKQ